MKTNSWNVKSINELNMENMLNLCRERFSARKFTSEKVSQEDLEYVMECVRMAPLLSINSLGFGSW